MNDRRESILLALLNSGLYQHEFKIRKGMANTSERRAAAACTVVAVCLHLDRAMGDIELEEINAAESFKCDVSESGEHAIEKPNGPCKFCGKIWTGTKWLKK